MLKRFSRESGGSFKGSCSSSSVRDSLSGLSPKAADEQAEPRDDATTPPGARRPSLLISVLGSAPPEIELPRMETSPPGARAGRRAGMVLPVSGPDGDANAGASQPPSDKAGGDGVGGGGSIQSGPESPAAESMGSFRNESLIPDDDRLFGIADAGGIVPLIQLLSSGTPIGKEQSSGALWHLAMDATNQNAIARANGIPPLVSLLDFDEGTELTFTHAADALARLALNDEENQAQIAKRLVVLLSAEKVVAQVRAARALWNLAADQPNSPVVILNAGALLPLVKMLSSGAPEARKVCHSRQRDCDCNTSHAADSAHPCLLQLIG